MENLENQSALSVFDRKRKILLCLVLCVTVVLNGCIIKREPYPKTTCNVCSVEGMIGSHNYMCQNETDTYLYSKDGIYKYKDGNMELLVRTAGFVEYMVCNSKVLYYVCYDELYRVCLDTGIGKNMNESGNVVGMSSYQEDIFIVTEEVSSQKDEGKDAVYYYHLDEDGILLNDILDKEITQSEDYTTAKYREYIIGGYKENEHTRVVLVKAEEKWNYSYDYNALVYIEMNNNLLRLDYAEYVYGAQKEKMESVLEVEDYGGRTTASHCAIVGEEIYMLYQYGDKYQGYGENPAARFKKRDAFFVLNPEKQACKLIYAPKKRSTQIAGFSVEKQILYLLEDDGIYRCDFDGKNKKKLLDNHYEELSFEYCDGKLFVFFSSDNGEAEFLAAVE